jgi:hypothetical protein
MVALADIVPQTREVEIAGGTLRLRGLGLRHIADLFLRFPELRKFFVPTAPEIDIPVLIVEMPDAIGAIIAEAAGEPNMADRVAEALSPDDVAACLLAVQEMTMPAPFFTRLAALLAGGSVLNGVDQRGREADMSAPLPPSSLLATGTMPEPSSTTRRGNSAHSSPSPATAAAER